MTPDIEKPLNISRKALIDRLQENLDKERAERETAHAKEVSAREEVEKILGENLDKVANFFRGEWGGSWSSIKEVAEEQFVKNSYYDSKDSTPTAKENDLEKFVRVLNMSSDETIEVRPNQPIYGLL